MLGEVAGVCRGLKMVYTEMNAEFTPHKREKLTQPWVSIHFRASNCASATADPLFWSCFRVQRPARVVVAVSVSWIGLLARVKYPSISPSWTFVAAVRCMCSAVVLRVHFTSGDTQIGCWYQFGGCTPYFFCSTVQVCTRTFNPHPTPVLGRKANRTMLCTPLSAL